MKTRRKEIVEAFIYSTVLTLIARALAAENGTFEIKGVPDGRYILKATHPLYMPRESQVFEVTQGMVLETIELEEAAVLSIEIDGLPYAGSRLSLESLETAKPKKPAKKSAPVMRLTTGRYLTVSLPRGNYVLVIRRPGYREFRHGPIEVRSGGKQRLKVRYKGERK